MKKILRLDLNYSAIQLLYFGAYAALMGYASNYLLSKGFTSSVIGITLAAVSVIALITQPVVAQFADNHKKIDLRYIIIAIMAAVVALNVLIYFMGSGSALLLCVFVGIVTGMMTITPLLNSLAFLFEKKGIAINFGLGRGIGSAGYAIISLGVGYLVEDYGESILPLIYLALNLLLILFVYLFVVPKQYRDVEVVEEVKEEAVEEETSQLSFFGFMAKYKRFTFLCLGTVLVFFAHTIINNFFIQVITPIGGTSSAMGTAVFLAAMLELPAMSAFDSIREKVGCDKMIKIAVIAYIIKHAITWFAPSMFFIYIAQCFQLVSYAILTPATVYYVNQIVEKKDAIKGQSLVTMSYTASGIVANLVGGILLDALGVKPVLFVGVIITAIGAFITITFTDKVH